MSAIDPASLVKHIVLPEKHGPGLHRLGRHVEHDPRSRHFGVPRRTAPLVSTSWKRHCPAFDQGDIGACEGNMLAGLLMTEPYFKPGRILGEKDALTLYSAATRLDNIAGHYPPNDTGTSTLAVAKAAQRAYMIGGYQHAFGIGQVLSALMHGPVGLGIPWFEGFDQPTGPHALVQIAGSIRGGHAIEAYDLNVENKTVGLWQSWGAWGDGGTFTMSWDTLEQCLKMDGDALILTI